MIVHNSGFIEIHKWSKSEQEWKRFLEDLRIYLSPEIGIKGKVIALIIAHPQLVLEKKVAYVQNNRLYNPREILKKVSKYSWVAELVIKIIQ